MALGLFKIMEDFLDEDVYCNFVQHMYGNARVRPMVILTSSRSQHSILYLFCGVLVACFHGMAGMCVAIFLGHVMLALRICIHGNRKIRLQRVERIVESRANADRKLNRVREQSGKIRM